MEDQNNTSVVAESDIHSNIHNLNNNIPLHKKNDKAVIKAVSRIFRIASMDSLLNTTSNTTSSATLTDPTSTYNPFNNTNIDKNSNNSDDNSGNNNDNNNNDDNNSNNNNNYDNNNTPSPTPNNSPILTRSIELAYQTIIQAVRKINSNAFNKLKLHHLPRQTEKKNLKTSNASSSSTSFSKEHSSYKERSSTSTSSSTSTFTPLQSFGLTATQFFGLG
jgi:hypothetical protein